MSKLKGILEEDRRGRKSTEARAKAGRAKGVKTRGWAGTLKQRVRVARRLPQAVVKITSHNRGRKQVAARLHYISRDGELPLETDEGLLLENPDEIDEFVDHWAKDFARRKNSRDGMSVVVSLPPGTDKDAAVASVRDFLEDVFSANHAYAFAGHDDKDHFHVHAVIKMRGHDGKQLVTDKADLRHWREAYVACAKTHGIHLDASPRYARGVGRRATKREIQKVRERDKVAEVDDLAAADAIKAARAGRRRAHPGEVAMRVTNHRERVTYAKAAAIVVKEADSLPRKADRLAAFEMAASLARFAVEMPRPSSRDELLFEELGKAARRKTPKPGAREATPVVEDTARRIRRQLASFNSGRETKRVQAINRDLDAVVPRQRKRQRERDRDGPER